MTDILTMLAAPALAFAGGYLGYLVGRFGRAVYERWGWPGVAALVAGPLAALVGLTARRRPRPAPDTREEGRPTRRHAVGGGRGVVGLP
jgi:hypothetical protein